LFFYGSLGAGDRAQPCPLLPARRWEEWNGEQQFLILFLMEEFGGAAEEWELLRRLPWTRYRLEEYVIDFEERPERAGIEFPCFREPDDRDRGRRYFLTDLARASYAAHLRDEEAREAHRKGFPFGRYPVPETSAVKQEDAN
jgi:hypothetical protein